MRGIKSTEICEVRVSQPPTFDPADARVLVAFVGEDDELDYVTGTAMELAHRNRARLILYDRDAASAFADPLPNQWASAGEREQYGDPLSEDDLVRLGREPLARKVAAARRAGVDAWGWLPEHHGTDTMVDYARKQSADLILLPEGLEEPGLADRLKRETVGKAMDELEETAREGDGIAVLLVRPDRSTELAAGRLQVCPSAAVRAAGPWTQPGPTGPQSRPELSRQKRGELGVQAVLGEFAEDAGCQGAVLAHEHRLGQPDRLEGRGHLGPLVDPDGPGAAVLADERAGGAGAVVDQHAQDDQPLRAALVQGAPQQRELADARPAPGRPEVQQHGPAAIGRQVERAPVQRGEPELGSVGRRRVALHHGRVGAFDHGGTAVALLLPRPVDGPRSHRQDQRDHQQDA
jgi:nucleotide-binding universal stress UspA family protein